MRFDAVLFDLFHTLVLLQDVPEASTPEILGLDPHAWHRAIFEKGTHHALGTVRDPVESLRRIIVLVDPEIPEKKIREAVALRRRRFRSALMTIRPEILVLLEHLRGRRLRLGLISNAAYDEISAWSESPLERLFETVLFSCHEKLVKPDPEIYLRAASRLQIPPERCIFVGDGGNSEHRGAREAGMTTILFLGLLAEALPEVAAARAGGADWTADSIQELRSRIEKLLVE